MLTEPRPALDSYPVSAQANVAVVIPIPNDPDWTIFDELSQDISIIVCDDSDGKLSPPPRRNVRFFDYAAQRAVMGDHWPAIPHKSAACRNFGHYLAYREGFDIIVALDYDCRTRSGWLDEHLRSLTTVSAGAALRGTWINSVQQPGFYARGYPYEFRNSEASAVTSDIVSGEVKLNMGVWDNIVDLNGVDKLQRDPPSDPGLLPGERNYVALGNLPLCGMNTAFRSELTPAYFFLPDIWIEGWQLSRHDDIWGGYVLKKLMDKRADLMSFGRPVVEHTRQSTLTRVVTMEHYMHLMAREFFAIADEAADSVRPGGYAEMFGHFSERFCRGVDRSTAPTHYRQAYRELGVSMQRWAAAFR
jgi:hypothetical protein